MLDRVPITSRRLMWKLDIETSQSVNLMNFLKNLYSEYIYLSRTYFHLHKLKNNHGMLRFRVEINSSFQVI